MRSSVIAAQLYTVREFTQTPADIARTLGKIRALGYEAVQLSALGPIDPRDLKTMLDNEGLVAAATHTSWERLIDEPEAVIEEHRILDCRHTALGAMPERYRNAQGVKTFAREASEVAHRLAEGGVSFSYHNHHFEFERFGDRTLMHMLIEESDARLGLELDTYWVQRGGGDPAWWIRRVKGRIPIVHLKDMVVQGREAVMAEVGEGNLNWPDILAACREAGVAWYCIEQDICQRDPFESLGISFNNLKRMGRSG